MARPLRIEFSGAWYHVMNRGINRMKIYLNDEHKKMFLELLAEIVGLFQIKIHSYCLMDNHYHLLIETPHANLSKAMRHLNCIYTQRFNRSVKRDGALFRGRFKAILIEVENYLLTVSRYIHLNPIDANVIKDLSYFKWSSYNYFINLPAPKWLCTSHILNFFENASDYAEFVAKGVDTELRNFYNSSKSPPILGNKKFITQNIESLNANYKIETLPDVNRAIKLFDIDTIFNAVADYFSVEKKSLRTTFRNNYPRMLAIYLAKNLTQLTHQKISEYFTGITKHSISTTVLKCKKLIESQAVLKQDYLNLTKKLYDDL